MSMLSPQKILKKKFIFKFFLVGQPVGERKGSHTWEQLHIEPVNTCDAKS